MRLRRTIGLKKDEYHLNGKHLSRAEVVSLLESAGFSRSKNTPDAARIPRFEDDLV